MAIDCNSPKLLKFICSEYAQFTTQDVATVIFNLIVQGNEVEKQKTEEIWQLVLHHYTDAKRNELEAVLKFFKGTKIRAYSTYQDKEDLKKEITSKLN